MHMDALLGACECSRGRGGGEHEENDDAFSAVKIVARADRIT